MIQIDAKKLRVAAVVANAVITKCLLVAGGYFLGKWLDDQFGTSPYLMATFLCVGLALGLWWVVIVANRYKL